MLLAQFVTGSGRLLAGRPVLFGRDKSQPRLSWLDLGWQIGRELGLAEEEQAHADAYLDCMPAFRAHGSLFQAIQATTVHGVSGSCHLGLFNKCLGNSLRFKARGSETCLVPYLTSFKTLIKVSLSSQPVVECQEGMGWGKGSLLWDWLVDLSTLHLEVS